MSMIPTFQAYTLEGKAEPETETESDSGIGVRDVSGGATYRYDWPNVHKNGIQTFTFWWGAIHANSRVFIATSEVDDAGNRYIGGATYQVLSIAPKDGYVWFQVAINWGAPLRISTDFLVINP